MYEILNVIYGVVPTEEQISLIEEHYEEWPEHLGHEPYNGAGDSTGYIGVDTESELFNGIWEVHGKKLSDVFGSVKATDEQIEEAEKRCHAIRSEVDGCEDLSEPDLIFVYSTS